MLLARAVEMAERSFGLPDVWAFPARVGGLTDIINNPIYAAAVGFGAARHEASRIVAPVFRARDDKILSKVKHRMSDWLNEFFLNHKGKQNLLTFFQRRKTMFEIVEHNSLTARASK
jgi:cell division ATPase FtsA